MRLQSIVLIVATWVHRRYKVVFVSVYLSIYLSVCLSVCLYMYITYRLIIRPWERGFRRAGDSRPLIILSLPCLRLRGRGFGNPAQGGAYVGVLSRFWPNSEELAVWIVSTYQLLVAFLPLPLESGCAAPNPKK